MKAMEIKNAPVAGETTTSPSNTTPLSHIERLTDAFTGADFTTINFDELSKDPSGIKIIAILYSQSESELKKANDRILELSASIKFFKAFPTANIAFVIMNLVGTILVGLGAPSNLWLIILGAILVIAGNALPYCFIKKGDNL